MSAAATRKLTRKEQRAVDSQNRLSSPAASVIAKVTRDRIMCAARERWPQYRFDVHKGYCTPLHQQLLGENGPCEIHRWCFENVRRASGVPDAPKAG